MTWSHKHVEQLEHVVSTRRSLLPEPLTGHNHSKETVL